MRGVGSVRGASKGGDPTGLWVDAVNNGHPMVHFLSSTGWEKRLKKLFDGRPRHVGITITFGPEVKS
jgi:hypothetical protein